MLKGFIFALMGSLVLLAVNLQAEGFRDTDFLEVKSGSQVIDRPSSEPVSRRDRRQRRLENDTNDQPVRLKDGGVFDVGKVANHKVLRDDEVVELRNPRTGRLEVTIINASALPEDDLNRHDLEYEVMALDELSITVAKHDDKPKQVTVDWDGQIRYPLIGDVQVAGLTLEEIKDLIRDKFRDYVRDPSVDVDLFKRSKLARILIIGKGYREYSGHEKILDVLEGDGEVAGASYKTTIENVYTKVLVIRKKEDGSFYCIVIDMEHMFTNYDFRQNIPMKAGDIVVLKKLPPLLGYRFRFWWNEVKDIMDLTTRFNRDVLDIRDFKWQK
jgi:polysaccharide export outer membrane protein